MKNSQTDRSAKNARRKRKIKGRGFRQLSNHEKNLIFIMAMMGTNMSKIRVKRNYKRLNTPELGKFAKGNKFTGDVDAVLPPNDDTVIGALADKMLETNALRQTDSSKVLSSLEKTQCRALIAALDENANYLENIANSVAKSTGDLDSGINVVIRIGFQYVVKCGSKHKTGFINVGIGWAHAHEAKTVKGKEAHLWEGGPTTAKGTPPTSTQIVYTIKADCIFTGLASNTIFAYRHASIVSVASKSDSSASSVTTPAGSSLEKAATPIPMSKNKHPMFDFSKAFVINYGEWHYIVIP